MGKAEIVGGGDKGKYQIKILHDKLAVEAKKQKLTANIEQCDVKITELSQGISAAAGVVDTAQSELKSAIDDGDIELMRQKASALQYAQVALDEANRNKSIVELQKLSYKTAIGFLDKHSTADKIIEAWCIDYSENLSGSVDTVEIGRTGDSVFVGSGYGGNVYDRAIDGQLCDIIAMTPAAAFFNYAMAPAAERLKPIYRTGIISNVSKETNTCDVDIDSLEIFGVEANKIKKVSGAPIVYMNCHAVAFTDGDHVVVKFENAGKMATVVGFVDNPKRCTGDPFKLFINGVESCESNCMTLKNYYDSSGNMPNILYGSPSGTAYNSSDPNGLNYVGLSYPYWTEKTIIFRHDSHPDVVVRVDPMGNLPTMLPVDGGFLVWSAAGRDEVIHTDAVPSLFYCVDVSSWPQEQRTSANTELVDFQTLGTDYTVTPWKFECRGAEVTGADRFVDKTGVYNEGSEDEYEVFDHTWFDQTGRVLHIKTGTESQEVSASFDPLRALNPYHASVGYTGDFAAQRYMLAGGMHNMTRRVRVRVSGYGKFKLWFDGHYQNPLWINVEGEPFKLDESDGYQGVTPTYEKEFTCSGASQWFELTMPPQVLLFDSSHLIDSTSNLTFGQYFPNIAYWSYGIKVDTGEKVNLTFDLCNVLTDCYASSVSLASFEFPVTTSDKYEIMRQQRSLFDAFIPYSYQELCAAYPITTWAANYQYFWKLLQFGAVFKSYDVTINHHEAYNCIQALYRNDDSLANGLLGYDPYFPTYPADFHFIERIFSINTDGKTIGQISATEDNQKQIRFDNLRAYQRAQHLGDDVEKFISFGNYVTEFDGADGTISISHVGAVVAGSIGEPAGNQLFNFLGNSVAQYTYDFSPISTSTEPMNTQIDIYVPSSWKTPEMVDSTTYRHMVSKVELVEGYGLPITIAGSQGLETGFAKLKKTVQVIDSVAVESDPIPQAEYNANYPYPNEVSHYLYYSYSLGAWLVKYYTVDEPEVGEVVVERIAHAVSGGFLTPTHNI